MSKLYAREIILATATFFAISVATAQTDNNCKEEQQASASALDRCARMNLLSEEQVREVNRLEKMAREREAGRAKDIEENFTIADIERTVGDHLLKIPANYISPIGKRLSNKDYPPQLTLTIFLPSLSGYTKENWQYVGKVEGGMLDDRTNVVLVHKRQNSTNHDADGEAAEKLFDEFVASNPPKIEYLGQNFYSYHYLKTKLKLPTHLDDIYYIAGDNQAKDSFYLMCHVNDFLSPSAINRCQIFFLDHATQIYMNAHLPPKHFYMWKDIRVAFRAYLNKWVVK